MASPFESNKISVPSLSQASLVKMISDTFANLTDKRKGENTRYELSDAALSAFAVFFIQNPSFLAQQMSLQNSQCTKVILSRRALIQSNGRWQQFWGKIDQFGTQLCV